MSKISLVIIFLLQAGVSFAQKYFVFIDAENRQPFYVRVDSEFHSSSAEGHLILSQLKDSNYNVTIGFPGQTSPEQHYGVAIHGKDQAFELRVQEAGGLRLYDLQSNQWLSAQGGSGTGDDLRTVGVKKDDAFSRMMAGVVHDTAVLYNTYAMERALSDSPAVATTQPAPPAATTIPADTSTGSARPAVDTVVGTQPAFAATTSATPAVSDSLNHGVPANTMASRPADTTAIRPAGVIAHQPAARFNDSTATTPLYRPFSKDSATAAAPIPSSIGEPLYRPIAAVTKLSERRTQKNVRLVYADHSGNQKADTIVVIIPVDSPAVVKTAGHQQRAADSSRIPSSRAHGPNPSPDSPAVNSSTSYKPTMPPAGVTEAPRPHLADTAKKQTDSPRRGAKTTPFINSDCHDFATDFDVDKLRVKMLESGKDDDRVAVARKMFKSKCFSTRQIRVLSEVFTSDAAKFRFFEAAWPFAADDHFYELSDLLADPVYNSKFKTMTHQQ